MQERQIIKIINTGDEEECRADLEWTSRERVNEECKISLYIFLCWAVSKALTEASSQPSCEGLKASRRVPVYIHMGFCFSKIRRLKEMAIVVIPPRWPPMFPTS